MPSSLKERRSLPTLNNIKVTDSFSESDDAITFLYRSQTVKVVCTESYKSTLDALIDACPKLLKAPRALIGLFLETSGASGSQRRLTDSNWQFFYKSQFRNTDTIIKVTILPIPRPVQDNSPYLDVPSLSGHYSDSELTSAKCRTTNSSDSLSTFVSSNRSSCSCQSIGSSDGSFTAEITTHIPSSNPNPKRPILAISSAPNLSPQSIPSTKTTASNRQARSVDPKEQYKKYLEREKALLDKATGYHAEKRRAQLARRIDTTNYYNRLIAKEEKRKAKEEAKRSSSGSSKASSWIGRLF